MSHFIVVPCIDPDAAAEFVSLIDDTLRDRLIIIDNTPDGAVAARVNTLVGLAYVPFVNLGVAGSWNWGCREAFSQGAKFVTLASSSIRFWDGGHMLARTADLAAENSQWPYGFESMNGWHLFTLGRKTWETVGEFDEQFWPAYYEDNDYIWRMRCAGILEPAGGDRALRKIPWVGALKYGCEDAHTIKAGLITVDLSALEARYVAKWGGKPGSETIRGHINDHVHADGAAQ